MEPEPVVEPATPAVVEAHLQRMAEMLRAPRAAKDESVEVAKLRAQVPMLKDVGHGDKCTCEVCTPLRFPARTEVVPVPDAAPPEDAQKLATRYDELRAQFPPEGS